jgi:hypothetical protein
MPHPTVDYHTHVLIGVQASGTMTVICDWPHLPRQADVQDQIDRAPRTYARFLLCTPTAVLPAPAESGPEGSHGPFRGH